MWFTIISGLVILIFILSGIKIFVDVKRKKSKSFVIKEGIILFAILMVLIILDTRFVKEGKIKEKSAEMIEGKAQATIKEERERKLLSQLQDYTGELSDTDKPQVRLFLRQGLEHRIKEGYPEALEIFRQALDSNLTDEERLAFFILMGNCEAYLKEYNSAINYYYQAERLSRETGSDTALGVVFSNLALAHRLEEEPDGALENYFNLLELFRKMGNSSGEKNTLANIGFIYQMKGNVDSASVYQKRSLEIPGTETELLAEAAQMNNLALTYKSEGKLDTALALHEHALVLFQKAGYKKDQASVLSNIGLIYQEMGDSENALKYHQKAFEIDSTIGDVMGQAGDLTNIGSTWEQEGDFSKAKEFYQSARSLFEKIDAKREVEFVRDNIQRVEKKLKE
ncbi:MAG: tetratricopeptide repeat protein [candidate division Zixibacteria bacterium]|nr:tetratricopeptide repeat protein [candidate division Zixibacteria bacterium]